MSIMFQLFSAEDLRKLTSEQYQELRDIVVRAVNYSRDTSLKAAQTIAERLQTRHLPRPQAPIVPAPQGITGRRRRPAPDTPAAQSAAGSVEIEDQDIDFLPDTAKEVLQQRVKEVFQQLTGIQPRGLAVPPAGRTPRIEDLLDPTDLINLENRSGGNGRRVLESALTCELANLKTFEALKQVKQEADLAFIRLTGGQRPKGPDLLYSPFHQLSPLSPDRPGQTR
jgi:hypothetical protein